MTDLTRNDDLNTEPALQHSNAAKPARSKTRIEAIDIARGVALVAMAVYHFGWDLEFFGYMDPGTTATGGWRLFARSIASSFLFLVGISLFLAHGKEMRLRSYVKRLGMIVAAAAAISATTWFAMPNGFIFFGILHQIALASVVGLAFLRMPAMLVLLAAACVIAAPHFLRSPFFDHAALWWVGLSANIPHSNDYVPFFPWFGAVLSGIAAAKIAQQSGLLRHLAVLRFGTWQRPLLFFSRHSLAFYLLHQPVLIACVWAFAQFWPAAANAPEAHFTKACNTQCAVTRDAAFCTAYCACVLDAAESEGRVAEIMSPNVGDESRMRLREIAAECSMRADMGREMRGR